MNSSPSPIKIHLVVGTSMGILIVFLKDADCWQFRVLSLGGEVFGLSRIYYSAQAAEKAGREWIAQGS